MISNLFTILFVLAGSWKILDLIYVFQIKEYRMDRFIAAVHDEGIVHIILTPRRFPAKSVRNVLIAGISFILLGLHSWLVKDDIMSASASLLLFPLISFIFVLLGAYVTSIFAYVKRESIIKKALLLLSKSKVKVIGITGSYGKTTTKEYLYEILSSTFDVAKTDENMNSDVGVALSILRNVKPDTQYFIAEMG
ncbi:MAG: Mur ligase family protein, partial [Patescibacteria group bacterium]